MTPEQKKAAEYAEILLAFSRGEKLQMKHTHLGWGDRTDEMAVPRIGDVEYRIAPKPLECYVTFRGDKPIQLTEVALCADNQRIVLMREVTE